MHLSEGISSVVGKPHFGHSIVDWFVSVIYFAGIGATLCLDGIPDGDDDQSN
jgi:hypothetical protein